MDNGLIYDREIVTDYNDIIQEHKTVLELVGKSKKVLEFGCHTGYFSYWLKKNDCNVTGVDIYRPSIEKAQQYLDSAFVGNIEDEDLWLNFNDKKYDVILFMQVLEHLINPQDILLKSKKYLKPNGKIIFSIPNISNWNTRFSFFNGNFNYTDTGVMDRTHLRFFNYNTAINMIDECGFEIEKYKGVLNVNFSIFPNLRFIWRLNVIYNKILNLILKKKHNLVDVVMVFSIRIKLF
jgi:2-polyprenyl-3-methyl-5-hydroxy-6-metoxy-1,4-benzoquinol methylase